MGCHHIFINISRYSCKKCEVENKNDLNYFKNKNYEKVVFYSMAVEKERIASIFLLSYSKFKTVFSYERRD